MSQLSKLKTRLEVENTSLMAVYIANVEESNVQGWMTSYKVNIQIDLFIRLVSTRT